MNHDGIPNATGEVWEFVSNGPDHSHIREAYERNPGAWELQCIAHNEFNWTSLNCGKFNIAWYPAQSYRMRRRNNSANYGAGPLYSTDHVNRPPHYTQGDIECIDAMVAAYGREKVEIWATLNSFAYLWRCFSKHPTPGEDRGKAIWNLRFANGDDPRK